MQSSAAILGLEPARISAGDPAPRHMSGTLGDLSLSLYVDDQRPSTLLGVTISSASKPLSSGWLSAATEHKARVSHGRIVPEGLNAVYEHTVPNRLQPLGSEEHPFESDDPAFDEAIEAGGEEDELLAMFDHSTRARLIHVVRAFHLRLEQRMVHATVAIAGWTPSELVGALRLLLDAAGSLRGVPKEERAARLHANILSDRSGPTRARNLEVLLARYGDTEQAKTARAQALAGSDPDLMLVVALEAGDAGHQLLACIADLEGAPEEARSSALFQLAALAPSAYVPTFLRALASPVESVQVAAIGGLNMLDLAMVPLDKVLERLDDFEPDALRAALRMLSRVVEEGKKLDVEMRGRVTQALVERHAFEGHARAGALAIADQPERSGALSIDHREGEGALSVDRSARSESDRE